MQRGAKAAEAGIEAGEFLREKMLNCFTRGRQNWKLVRDFREEVARHLADVLKREYEGDGILCPALTLSKETETGCTWLVEPLVGQVNFGRGYPVAAVSLAAYVEEEGVLYGAVVDIFQRLLYRAARDQGAFEGETRLHVSKESSAEDLVLMMEPAHQELEWPVDTETFQLILDGLNGFANIRRIGCPALALCHVAAARADGFIQSDTDACSLAAGTLILKEAGGAFSQIDGEPIDFEGFSNILGSNGLVHETLVKAFTPEEAVVTG